MYRFPRTEPLELLSMDLFFVGWTVLFVGVSSISAVRSGSESSSQSMVVALWLVSGVFLCVAHGVFVVRRAREATTSPTTNETP